MASINKFYLHDATTSVTGTLPGGTAVAGSPSVTATGATTNRTLDGTIGTTQASASLATLAQTAAQSGFLRRLVSGPLGAQTIAAQTITFSGAFSESNNSSDFIPTIGLYAWRPSTGALVGTLLSVGTLTMTEPGTGQTALSSTATSTSVTVTTGDILVLELWRNNGTQTTSVSRTNSCFYDGTTEASTTSNAAFVNFATAVDDNSVQISSTLNADATVQFPAPAWVSPADGTSVVSTTPLVWTSVTSATNANFHLQLDSTSSAFAAATEYYSSAGGTSFEYWNGTAWVTLPTTGMPAASTGNQVRFTPPLTSINATRYRRVRQSY